MSRIRAGSRRLMAMAAIGVSVLAAGCGSKEEETAPAACSASSDAYLRALQAAPGPVVLAGSTQISDCLVPSQEAGQQANVGQAMIVTATKLNNDARQNPGSVAAVQLGYLVGAVRKGADPIHADLVRRMNASAQYSQTGGTLPPGVEAAFSRGYAAGRKSG